MRHVYILERGEMNSGGSVLAVCRTKQRAISEGVKETAKQSAALGPWVDIPIEEADRHRDIKRWECGCDYLLVHRVELL